MPDKQREPGTLVNKCIRCGDKLPMHSSMSFCKKCADFHRKSAAPAQPVLPSELSKIEAYIDGMKLLQQIAEEKPGMSVAAAASVILGRFIPLTEKDISRAKEIAVEFGLEKASPSPVLTPSAEPTESDFDIPCDNRFHDPFRYQDAPLGFWEYLENNKEVVAKWPGWLKGENRDQGNDAHGEHSSVLDGAGIEMAADQSGKITKDNHGYRHCSKCRSSWKADVEKCLICAEAERPVLPVPIQAMIELQQFIRFQTGFSGKFPTPESMLEVLRSSSPAVAPTNLQHIKEEFERLFVHKGEDCDDPAENWAWTIRGSFPIEVWAHIEQWLSPTPNPAGGPAMASIKHDDLVAFKKRLQWILANFCPKHAEILTMSSGPCPFCENHELKSKLGIAEDYEFSSNQAPAVAGRTQEILQEVITWANFHNVRTDWLFKAEAALREVPQAGRTQIATC